MSKISQRRSLRRKERKLVLRDVSQVLRIDAETFFGSKPKVEIIETSKYKVFLVNNRPIIAQSENTFFPTLFFSEYLNELPHIIVDMGAVPYLCSGADVMAPGVVSISEDFGKGGLVVVLDERNRRFLAIVQSLFSSEESRFTKKGKLFKNLHHVGDEIWDAVKDTEQERKS